ncbi:uncharacterized protein BDR25DRAFT_358419 [Lindgomyces ingoldianus]|uniref:Uncharacterized protein n=1 Tax=Lindgomyces ingoldianus TaxID=673940 RepID=A0ACB6QL38_9PLEO|nr:uncharacterized protein BDR25DRAFT_358419 [Lindgomyces ingoldianus]KAF2467729.1 hypothetical protein BDR25DRAFT_358419 [Lindgomyces ingoldianus]
MFLLQPIACAYESLCCTVKFRPFPTGWHHTVVCPQFQNPYAYDTSHRTSVLVELLGMVSVKEAETELTNNAWGETSSSSQCHLDLASASQLPRYVDTLHIITTHLDTIRTMQTDTILTSKSQIYLQTKPHNLPIKSPQLPSPAPGLPNLLTHALPGASLNGPPSVPQLENADWVVYFEEPRELVWLAGDDLLVLSVTARVVLYEELEALVWLSGIGWPRTLTDDVLFRIIAIVHRQSIHGTLDLRVSFRSTSILIAECLAALGSSTTQTINRLTKIIERLTTTIAQKYHFLKYQKGLKNFNLARRQAEEKSSNSSTRDTQILQNPAPSSFSPFSIAAYIALLFTKPLYPHATGMILSNCPAKTIIFCTYFQELSVFVSKGVETVQERVVGFPDSMGEICKDLEKLWLSAWLSAWLGFQMEAESLARNSSISRSGEWRGGVSSKIRHRISLQLSHVGRGFASLWPLALNSSFNSTNACLSTAVRLSSSPGAVKDNQICSIWTESWCCLSGVFSLAGAHDEERRMEVIEDLTSGIEVQDPCQYLDINQKNKTIQKKAAIPNNFSTLSINPTTPFSLASPHPPLDPLHKTPIPIRLIDPPIASIPYCISALASLSRFILSHYEIHSSSRAAHDNVRTTRFVEIPKIRGVSTE